jgi:hypothetical protein
MKIVNRAGSVQISRQPWFVLSSNAYLGTMVAVLD